MESIAALVGYQSRYGGENASGRFDELIMRKPTPKQLCALNVGEIWELGARGYYRSAT